MYDYRVVAKATPFPAKLWATLRRAIPVNSRSSIASTAITFSWIPQNDEANASQINDSSKIASEFLPRALRLQLNFHYSSLDRVMRSVTAEFNI